MQCNARGSDKKEVICGEIGRLLLRAVGNLDEREEERERGYMGK